MLFKKLASAGFAGPKTGNTTLTTLVVCGGMMLSACHFATPAEAQTLPVLTITGVANNIGSAKIMYSPIPGAQDYRVYDVTDPSKVKYAGQWHLTAGWGGWSLAFNRNADGSLAYPLSTTTQPNFPGGAGEMVTLPAWEIEWNGVQPGQQETLVVEAVDELGPVPSGNLYSGTTNAALETCTDGMCMVGSNEGITLDGLLSTNGQGAPTNTPHVIARSLPFVVGTPIAALPQMQGSNVFEPFSTATMKEGGPVDNEMGNMSYTVQGNKPWQVFVQQADIAHSNSFIENGHFMDVLFDGGTPGISSLPMHNNHAAIALSPIQTVEIGGGHILHVTMEVDSHMDGRRWAGIVVAPANDPVQSFYSNTGFRVNNSNLAFFAEVQGKGVNFVQETGPATGTTGTQSFQGFQRPALCGPALQPMSWGPSGLAASTANLQYQQIGRGIDDRSRFDLFLSATHASMFEDGIKVADYNLTQPLGFPRCKIYFAHYVYHTTNELNEDTLYTPWETYWINTVPFSDERHWSNMGYEILPNTAQEWNNAGAFAQPKPYQAPTFAPGGPLK